MKTYKTIEHLKKECLKNNGKPVFIWNDKGIKVNGKIYRQMEYGNMGYNFKGNCYITFRNTGKKGRQKIYGNRDNFSDKDNFITIEYSLNKNPKEEIKTDKKYLFEFILIRENY